MKQPEIGVYWSGRQQKFMIHEGHTDHEVTDEEFFKQPELLACKNDMKNRGYVDAVIGITKVAEKTKIEGALKRLEEMKQKVIGDK